MRAIISPSGSFTPMLDLLPARLDQARVQTLGAQISKRDARKLVLAVIAARAPRNLATVANAGRRRVARHFRELERRREPLLHRSVLVARNGPQPGTPARILFGKLAPSVVLLNRTFLRHQYLLNFRV